MTLSVRIPCSLYIDFLENILLCRFFINMRFYFLVCILKLTVQVGGQLLFINIPLIFDLLSVRDSFCLFQCGRRNSLFQIIYRRVIFSGNSVFFCGICKMQFISVIAFQRFPVNLRYALGITARSLKANIQVAVKGNAHFFKEV